MELITALFVCAYSYILCECILNAVRITAQCIESTINNEREDTNNTENNLDKNINDNEKTNRDLEKD